MLFNGQACQAALKAGTTKGAAALTLDELFEGGDPALKADRIRDRLNELNVVVMDGPTGATWRVKG